VSRQHEELRAVLTGSHFIEHSPGAGEHLEVSPQAAAYLADKIADYHLATSRGWVTRRADKQNMRSKTTDTNSTGIETRCLLRRVPIAADTTGLFEAVWESFHGSERLERCTRADARVVAEALTRMVGASCTDVRADQDSLPVPTVLSDETRCPAQRHPTCAAHTITEASA
jgi:hypothetical protein